MVGGLEEEDCKSDKILAHSGFSIEDEDFSTEFNGKSDSGG